MPVTVIAHMDSNLSEVIALNDDLELSTAKEGGA